MGPNLFDVSGSVVLVSGGSRGIGFAIAKCFFLHGAQVIITGRNEESLKKSCELVNSTGDQSTGTMSFTVCDITSEQMIKACVEDVISRHQRIDTLVNCAGINQRKPAEDYTAEDFDLIMNTNLRGTFLMSQAVGKQMIKQGGGSQINIDSLATYAPLTQTVPYSMSKSAMSSMTRGLAQEWGKHGVRVNGLAPGFILTDLNKELWSDQQMQNWNQTVAPLRRLGTPDDLIAAAIFLASPGAFFITGQTIRIDGGLSAGINWPIAGDFEVTNLD